VTPGEYRDLQNRMNRQTAARLIPVLRPAASAELSPARWARLIAAVFLLISDQRTVSSELALAYYASLSPTGTAPPVEPTEYAPAMTRVGLERVLGAPEVAQENPLRKAARATAAMIRHAEQGGRETVLRATRSDGVRFARMDPRPPTCAWCTMMISRGPVFLSDETDSGGFLAHDRDTCVPVPVFPGRDWAGREQYEAAEQLYREVAAGLSTTKAVRALREATTG
jgi:hypothetical protein